MRGTSCPSRSDLTYSLKLVRVFVDVAKKGGLLVNWRTQYRISLQRHGMYCSHNQYLGQLGKITHKLRLRNGGFDEGSLTAL